MLPLRSWAPVHKIGLCHPNRLPICLPLADSDAIPRQVLGELGGLSCSPVCSPGVVLIFLANRGLALRAFLLMSVTLRGVHQNLARWTEAALRCARSSRQVFRVHPVF